MNRNLLVVGVALAAVATVGTASAKTSPRHHHRMAAESGHFAAPSQPIPYDQVGAYLSGSSHKRAEILAQAGAATGTAADTAATAPSPAPADDATTPAAGDMSKGDMSTANPAPVNPPAAAPAMPDATTATPPN